MDAPPAEDRFETGDGDADPWIGATALFFAVTVTVAVFGALQAARAESTGEPALKWVTLGLLGPTVARAVVRLTVDRGRPSPMPIFGPRWSVAPIGLPVVLAASVYAAAYVGGLLVGDVALRPSAPPFASGGLLLAFFISLWFAFPGALGSELGWRGWLQPRLDQAGIRGSLPIVVVLEAAASIPTTVLLGSAGGLDPVTSVLLYGCLRVGATPLWTWTMYRTRSVWAAVWFRAAHVTFGGLIFAALFEVTGRSWMVGEIGVLPILAYGVAAVAVLGKLWAGGGSWNGFARWSLEPPSAPDI